MKKITCNADWKIGCVELDCSNTEATTAKTHQMKIPQNIRFIMNHCLKNGLRRYRSTAPFPIFPWVPYTQVTR